MSKTTKTVALVLAKLLGFQSVASTDTPPLEIGSPAPQFSALNQDGKKIDLASILDKKLILIYFYPRADTPGCTAQSCSLRDAYTDLQKKGVTIFGISTDSVEDQKKFQKKFHLPFDLLSDKDQKIAAAYQVPVRLGFASRQAFLIHEGKILWLDRSASTKEQAQDVLKVLETRQ